MQDLDLLGRQLRRETEQGAEARHRLTNNTREAEEKKYASSTIYGQKLLKHSTGVIAEHMTNTLKHAAKGRGGQDFQVCYTHLKSANTEILAVIALKVALDTLAITEKPTPVQLGQAIGGAIETELRLQWYKKQDKDLYRQVEQGFHGSTGTSQKATVFRLRFNKAGLEWKSWGATVQFKVGSWALRSVIETTGWVTQDIIKGARAQKTVMRFSREFLGMRDAIMERALELSYCLWPMLCPPNDWSDDQRGGYLTEEIRQSAPLIRRASPIGATKQGTVPLTFLNNLQQQAYRLNPAILAVANWAYDSKRTIGKFICDSPRDRLEPFVGDPEAEPDRFKEWKRTQRSIDDHNAQLFQKNWRATETMFVANMYADEPQFWIPWSYDYRGRVYPQNTQLNPQGTDFDKSLLLFAEEGPVNEYWLGWHAATTYGRDKDPHDARAQWARDNVELITLVAEDPISNLSLWEQADEPWMFLAAAIEYHACVITKQRHTSGLPIGIDATCSGLQHLASMTRDRNAAEQVNVIKGAGDGPSDGYKTVAEASLKYIEDTSIHPFMDRKTTKRTVMTVPYGVSRDSARAYIREALHAKGFDLSIKGRLSVITDAIYRKAVPEVFEGPVNVMNWLQKTAVDLLSNGAEHIEWTTPSGFHVVQDLRKPKAKRIKTSLMGTVQQIWVGDGYGEVDVKHHKGAIAPNLVHSLDASLLHLCFYEWDKPFTVIHDCVMGRSCDMDQMMKDIRRHHADIYLGHPLEAWADEQGVDIPEGLIKGDLDLEDVIDSPYFFC